MQRELVNVDAIAQNNGMTGTFSNSRFGACMKILNFGSLNLDYVYSVPHFVAAGETLAAMDRQVFPGGKGLNQSIALAKAKAHVYHAGAIGLDGMQLLKVLMQGGVNPDFVRKRPDLPTGHAIIQVDQSGQNCILIYGGANQSQRKDEIIETISSFSSGDMLLLQNEVNEVDTLIHQAKEKHMTVVLNPSPITPALLNAPLEKVDIFILNEIEARFISGVEDAYEQINALGRFYPKSDVVLTLGEKGSLCLTASGEQYEFGIFNVPVTDTTAAGDAFTGFYLASFAQGKPINEALKIASAASAIAVTRPGASVSIPDIDETEEFLLNYK